MENDQLRTASSLRFVFTKKKKEVKVVEVKKPQENVSDGHRQKRAPGRRQADPSVKKKTEKDLDVQKKKLEWGKAFKFVQENKEPQFPMFLAISSTQECSSDPFYLKIFREMAYGSFPKGVFYDSNRDTLVCTEPPGKRNQAVRRKKFEKYVRVCLPLRPQIDFESRTALPTKDTFTETDNDDLATVETHASEEVNAKKVIKYIHRSYQRLELPLLILRDNFQLSLERIYQEIKLFIYMTIDILSPKDSILLQEDSYQSIQTGELITSLKPQKTWKRLSRLDHVSLLCQFCRQEFIRTSPGLTLSNLTNHQMTFLREIEDFVVGLYQTGVIPASYIQFDGVNITGVDGITINYKHGLIMDRDRLNQNSKEDHEVDQIAPVAIQEYKAVDLQKISNSITKQASKYSKLVQDLTGVLDDEEI